MANHLTAQESAPRPFALKSNLLVPHVMKPNSKAPLLLAVLLAGTLAPVTLRHEPATSKPNADNVQQVAAGESIPAGLAGISGTQIWWARSWSKGDSEGFSGQPAPSGSTHLRLVQAE